MRAALGLVLLAAGVLGAAPVTQAPTPPTPPVTAAPKTASPTKAPTTTAPTTTAPTTPAPSTPSPTTPSPTLSPTVSPTPSPTLSPTASPTPSPTLSPTPSPTMSPTPSPTLSPTPSPTTPSPTLSPTFSPTPGPTVPQSDACREGNIYNASTCVVSEMLNATLSGMGDDLANKMFHSLFCLVTQWGEEGAPPLAVDDGVMCTGPVLDRCRDGSMGTFPSNIPLYCYKGDPTSSLVFASGAFIGCPRADTMCALQIEAQSVTLNGAPLIDGDNMTTLAAASINILAHVSINVGVRATIDASGPFYNSTAVANLARTPGHAVACGGLHPPGQSANNNQMQSVDQRAAWHGVPGTPPTPRAPGGTMSGFGGFLSCGWAPNSPGWENGVRCSAALKDACRTTPAAEGLPETSVGTATWGGSAFASNYPARFDRAMFGQDGWCAATELHHVGSACADTRGNTPPNDVSRPSGATGGGRVWLTALGAAGIVVDGLVRAEGQSSSAALGGAGSGGSIVLNATVVGGTGVVSVDGGDGWPLADATPAATDSAFASGGGGGGRVSILCDACGMVQPYKAARDPSQFDPTTSGKTLTVRASGGAAGTYVEKPPRASLVTYYGIGGPGTSLLANRNGTSQTLSTFSADLKCGSASECGFAPASTYVAAGQHDGLGDLVISSSALRIHGVATVGAGLAAVTVIVPTGLEGELYVARDLHVGVQFAGTGQAGVDRGVAIDLLYSKVGIGIPVRTNLFQMRISVGGRLVAIGAFFGVERLGCSDGSDTRLYPSVRSAHIVAQDDISLESSSIYTENDLDSAVRTTLRSVLGNVELSSFSRVVSTEGALEIIADAGAVIIDETKVNLLSQFPLRACDVYQDASGLVPVDLDTITVSLLGTTVAIAGGSGVTLNGTICVVPTADTAGNVAAYLNQTTVEIFSPGNITLVANIRGFDGGIVIESGDTISLATGNMTGTFISLNAARTVTIEPVPSSPFNIAAVHPTLNGVVDAEGALWFSHEACDPTRRLPTHVYDLDGRSTVWSQACTSTALSLLRNITAVGFAGPNQSDSVQRQHKYLVSIQAPNAVELLNASKYDDADKQPGGEISSPTIEMCAGRLGVWRSTAISAARRGFVAGDTSALGSPLNNFNEESADWSWPGAGHGGLGGAANQSAPVGQGGTYDSNTSAHFPILYTPSQCGSGGGGIVGSRDQKTGEPLQQVISAFTGGSGGGLIRLLVETELSLNGSIDASGANGISCCAIPTPDGNQPNYCEIGDTVTCGMPRGAMHHPVYGGGGSGGTILVRIRHRVGLHGDGSLLANGGNGSQYLAPVPGFPAVLRAGAGGGGGGGGCLESFWEGINVTAQENFVDIKVAINVTGGFAGCAVAGNGEKGTSASLDCPAGTGNFACQSCKSGYQPKNTSTDYTCEPCRAGTFSPLTGDNMCQQCDLGTAAPDEKATECDVCPVGHFADELGLPSCKACCCDSSCSPKGTLNEYGLPCCPSLFACNKEKHDCAVWFPNDDGLGGQRLVKSCLRHRYPRKSKDDDDELMTSLADCWKPGVFACEPGFITFGGDPTKDCWNPAGLVDQLFDLDGDSPYVGILIVAFLFVGAGIAFCMGPLLLIRGCRAWQRRRQSMQVPVQSMRITSMSENGERASSLAQQQRLNLRSIAAMRGGGDSSVDSDFKAEPLLMSGNGAFSPNLADGDLTHLIDRVYLNGTNSFASPWRMPLAVPARLSPHFQMSGSPKQGQSGTASVASLDVASASGWRALARRCNGALAWAQCQQERVLHVALTLCYFPLAEEFLVFRRRARFYRLQSTLLAWQESNSKLITIKANCSPDFTLAYIDVLWFADEFTTSSVQRSEMGVGPPALPLMLRIAGDGSYHHPFFLDTNDAMVRFPPNIDGKRCFMRNMGGEGWIDFVYNLNARLWSVDPQHFNATIKPCLAYISSVNAGADIVYDDEGNEAIHDLGGLKACVGLVRDKGQGAARSGGSSGDVPTFDEVFPVGARLNSSRYGFDAVEGGTGGLPDVDRCSLWLLLVDAMHYAELGLDKDEWALASGGGGAEGRSHAQSITQTGSRSGLESPGEVGAFGVDSQSMRIQLDRSVDYPIDATYLQELEGTGLEFQPAQARGSANAFTMAADGGGGDASAQSEGSSGGSGSYASTPLSTEELRVSLRRRAQMRRKSELQGRAHRQAASAISLPNPPGSGHSRAKTGSSIRSDALGSASSSLTSSGLDGGGFGQFVGSPMSVGSLESSIRDRVLGQRTRGDSNHKISPYASPLRKPMSGSGTMLPDMYLDGPQQRGSFGDGLSAGLNPSNATSSSELMLSHFKPIHGLVKKRPCGRTARDGVAYWAGCCRCPSASRSLRLTCPRALLRNTGWWCGCGGKVCASSVQSDVKTSTLWLLIVILLLWDVVFTFLFLADTCLFMWTYPSYAMTPLQSEARFWTCSYEPYSGYIIFFVFPFALVAAPVFGLLTLCSRRPVRTGRLYASLTTLSFVNVLVGLGLLLSNIPTVFDPQQQQNLNDIDFYFMLFLACGQLVVKFVEAQVCHVFLFVVVTGRKHKKWSALYWTEDDYDSSTQHHKIRGGGGSQEHWFDRSG